MLSPDLRRPERVFLREGSPDTGTMPLPGDPSRKKTRSGRRGSGNGIGSCVLGLSRLQADRATVLGFNYDKSIDEIY